MYYAEFSKKFPKNVNQIPFQLLYKQNAFLKFYYPKEIIMKKVFAALTALLCLCGSMPVMAEESAPITGTYEGLDWTLEDHVLIVNGDTNIYAYDDGFDGDGDRHPDWEVYSEDIYEIIIEEGVTGADAYALSGYPNLTKLTLPSTFAYLEPYALYDNPQLSEINGLEYVTEFNFECLGNTAYIAENPFVIADGVLRYAEGTDLVVPEGVREIAPYAFGNMDSDKYIVDPEEGDSIYYEITLPDSVEIIDDYAFALCATMTSINIPDSVQKIGDGAFMWCASLGDITLGKNVASVGDYAFWNCKSLKNLTVLGDTTFGTHAYGEGIDWITMLEQDSDVTEEDRAETLAILEQKPLAMDEMMVGFILHFWDTRSYDNIGFEPYEEDSVYDFLITGTITGHTGSDAQRYAEEYNIPFEALDELMLGDLNDNGELDIVDVIILNQYLLLGEPLTPAQQTAADFDENGEINPTDSLALLKAVVKIQ